MNPSQQQQLLPVGYVEASSFIQAYSPEPTPPGREEAPTATVARVSATADPSTIPNTTTAEPSKATVSRDGIRGGKRWDNQPNVYRELPSFPKFDQSIPNDASIEEICINYPNHIRGTYLAAFVQWHWTANDIYNRLTDIAKQEFIDHGVATCKTKNNRANFLFKRLDAYLKSLTAEEVTALCTQPKFRPCLMNGGERYGNSKLRGKFNNPNAQPIRHLEYTPRTGANKRKAAEDLPQQSEAKKSKTDARSDPLWESMDIFEQYKYAMAGRWRKQVGFAQAIIDADVYYSEADGRQCMQQILQMLKYPVNSTSESFLTFQHIEDCPAFAAFVDNKARAVFDEIRVREAGATTSEARNKAVDAILTEQRHIETTLQHIVPGVTSSHGNENLRFGLVQQAIQAVTNASVQRQTQPDRAAANTGVLQQASGWADASRFTTHAGRKLKRTREETAAGEASNKRLKSALSPGLSLAGKSMPQIFGGQPGPQVFNTQQAFQPVEYPHRLEDAPGVGRDFDLMFEEIYGTSTAPPALTNVHGQSETGAVVNGYPSQQQTQNIGSGPGLSLAGVGGEAVTSHLPQVRTDAEDQALQEAIDMLPSLPPTPSIIYDETDFSIVPEQNQVTAGNAYVPQNFDMFAQPDDHFLQDALLFPPTDLLESYGVYTQTGDLFSQGADLFSMNDLPQSENTHDGMFDAAIEDLATSSSAANVTTDLDFDFGGLTASELQQMQEGPAFWDGMFNDL